MFTIWQFFAPLNHKYLGSTMKNIENSRTILSIYNLFWKQYTSHWIILKRLRATTVTRSPDVRVANDDLSVSSRKSIEIRSRNIVFCRLEMGNCVHFLLGRMSISLCWPMRVVKNDIYLYMNLSSSLVQTVSVTTVTTWRGTLKRIGECSIPLVRQAVWVSVPKSTEY